MVALVCSKAVSNDFLEEFTCALEKGDGSVGFGEGVVWLVRFGDDDHVRGTPWVCPVFQGAIERGDDEAGIRLKRPLKEFVGDPGRPRGRFVGGVSEGLTYFVFGDAVEWSLRYSEGGTTTIYRLEQSANLVGTWTTVG
jgi:hypothetical protein